MSVCVCVRATIVHMFAGPMHSHFLCAKLVYTGVGGTYSVPATAQCQSCMCCVCWACNFRSPCGILDVRHDVWLTDLQTLGGCVLEPTVGLDVIVAMASVACIEFWRRSSAGWKVCIRLDCGSRPVMCIWTEHLCRECSVRCNVSVSRRTCTSVVHMPHSM